MPQQSSYLSAEEIAFLRDLFAEGPDPGDADGGAARARHLLLDTAQSDAEVLASLVGADRLTLTAERAGLQFRFELTVHRPADGHPVSLRVGYPHIVDRHGRERAARVEPAPHEIGLVGLEGADTDVAVRDISASGLSLTEPTHVPRRPHERIRLRLRLDGEDRNVEGRIVRVQREPRRNAGRRTLGIEFEHADPATRAILDRFVFRHHPSLRR